MKLRLIKISENLHHPIHLAVGLAVGILYYLLNPGLEIDKVLFYGGLGGLVPDLDHFLFMYVYGRSSEYSKIAREKIRNRELRNLINFLKTNHKKNSGIFSHNLLTVIVIYIFVITAKNTEHIYLAIFLLSCIFHFLFDVLEDIVYFGKINPNWYLKFNKHARDLEEF